MRRSAWLVPLVPFALAACTADKEVAAPLAASTRAVSSASAANSGRYIVGAYDGFADDFAIRVAALGGAVESMHKGAGIAVVTGLTAEAASQLGGVTGISAVEADAEFTIDHAAPTFETDMTSAEPSINSQANPATAGRYAWQWNMRLIQADKAWALGKLGSSTVTAAILDSGIDYDAPDFVGLVDLTRSKSFVPKDDSITAKYFPTRNPISDYNGHGTNVATQVSSKAVALAGVTSKTTLIGVKVLGRTGSGSTSGVLNGILWAADHGADVANMSLGSSFLRHNAAGIEGFFNKVFNYAKNKGMVIVVSAGNDEVDLQHNGNGYSAYCDAPHVICVSAVGPRIASDLTPLTGGAQNPLADSPAFYTNYGRQMTDIAAPGGNALPIDSVTYTVSAWPWGNDIASWVWSYCPKTRIASVDSTTGVPTLTACVAGNRLSGFIGTSQAAPHVTGLVALLVAEKGRNQPQKVKQMIQKSADAINPLLGRGRINVLKALSQ